MWPSSRASSFTPDCFAALVRDCDRRRTMAAHFVRRAGSGNEQPADPTSARAVSAEPSGLRPGAGHSAQQQSRGAVDPRRASRAPRTWPRRHREPLAVGGRADPWRAAPRVAILAWAIHTVEVVGSSPTAPTPHQELTGTAPSAWVQFGSRLGPRTGRCLPPSDPGAVLRDLGALGLCLPRTRPKPARGGRSRRR
jgi:hypothetical protein